MKKITVALLCLLMILSISTMAFAEEMVNPELSRVVDLADIFSPDEENNLQSKARSLIDKYGMDFVIYTDNDGHGKSIEAGADDFYDENGYGCGSDLSGVVVYICFDPEIRAWWTSACGKAMQYIDYNNINIIDDAIMQYMVDGDYYVAMDTYIDYIDELYEKGSLYNENNQSYYTGDSGWQSYQTDYPSEKSNSIAIAPVLLVVSAVIGLVVGLISKSKARKSMITVENAERADDYKANGSFKLVKAENIFLNMVVSRVPKPQVQETKNHHSMHSGGSSFSGSHTSSSGHTHSGGGGRHF